MSSWCAARGGGLFNRIRVQPLPPFAVSPLPCSPLASCPSRPHCRPRSYKDQELPEPPPLLNLMALRFQQDEQDAEEAAAKSVTGGLLRGLGWGGASRPRSAPRQGQQQQQQ